jgi:hypothetical protein
MTVKSFFSDEECRQVGFSEPMIRTLKQIADFVDTVTRVADAEAAQALTDAAVTAIQEDQEDQNLTLATLDTRIDHFEALEPLVRQDQGAAWTAATGTASRAALASYAGQTVSATPTQAEVQAIDDAVKAISQAVVALITDCKANGVLT